MRKNLITLGLLISFSCMAQEPRLDAYIESIVEEIAANSDEDVDFTAILSDLEQLRSAPLNLNTATPVELSQLFILSDFQIASIIEYRKKYKKIYTVHELRYAFGFNNRIVDLINPFVICGDTEYRKPQGFKNILKRNHHEVLLRTSYNSKTSDNYLGSPLQEYARYLGHFSNKLDIGIIAENDGGEEFFNGNNSSGFDFYSGHVQYHSNSILKNITLGDYRIRLGQGLLMWNGFNSGKSSEITALKKRGQGISANTSKDEFNFMRGAAVSFSKNGFSANIWGSTKSIDGIFDSVDHGIELRSINTTGYHRTETEIARKGNIDEITYGASISHKASHFGISLNWLHTGYSQIIIPDNDLHKLKNFSGNKYNGLSVDYNILFQKIQFYGEVAYGNNAIANVSGINFLPSSALTTTLFYRYYAPSYFSPYSNGVVESGGTSNEEGFFGGINWQTDWNVRISAYADIFSFPWASYSSDRPSSGADYFVQVNYKTYSGLDFIIRYKYKAKEKDITSQESKTHQSEVSYRQNVRLHAGFQISESLRLASRFEWCESSVKNVEAFPGYLIYQDVVYNLLQNTTLYFRYAQYDVDDYDARIYAYENDALYAYSMPAYYGEGQKTYFMFRQKFKSGITFWLRYAYTGFFNDDYKEKHEVKGQLMVKF